MGLEPFCENGEVLQLRRLIQDDPLVVKELALRLKKLKRVFNHYTVCCLFKFQQSAMYLFEMQDINITSTTAPSHFWYPLKPQDLWTPFVQCMMTVLDEIHHDAKYQHILLVEFYEWIARVAIKYYQLSQGEESDQDVTNLNEQSYQ